MNKHKNKQRERDKRLWVSNAVYNAVNFVFKKKEGEQKRKKNKQGYVIIIVFLRLSFPPFSMKGR